MKSTNLVEDGVFLLPVRLSQIPGSGFRVEVENNSDNHRPGGHLGFPIGSKNKTLLEDVVILLSSFFEFCLAVLEEKPKMWKVNDVRRTYGRTTEYAWSQ